MTASLPDPARVRVIVSGRVQGVWFRASTRETALRLGLAGWVRNLPGGEVEAVFEGPRAAVEQAVDWCRQGPSAARVDFCDAIWEPSEGEGPFRIRHG